MLAAAALCLLAHEHFNRFINIKMKEILGSCNSRKASFTAEGISYRSFW
jgi:hypothetical protein